MMVRARASKRPAAEVLTLQTEEDIANLNEIIAHASNHNRGKTTVSTQTTAGTATLTSPEAQESLQMSVYTQNTADLPRRVPLAPPSFVSLQERPPDCILSDAQSGDRLIHIDIHPYLAHLINVRNSVHPDLARVVKIYTGIPL